MRLGFAGLDHHPLNLEIKKATYGKSERRHEDVSNEVKLSHRQHQALGQELIKEEELLNSILVISSFDFCSILNGEPSRLPTILGRRRTGSLIGGAYMVLVLDQRRLLDISPLFQN